MADHVTLKIHRCDECPNLSVGMGYSLDGLDHGRDWKCEKAKRMVSGFFERDDDKPSIPDWCPLRGTDGGRDE